MAIDTSINQLVQEYLPAGFGVNETFVNRSKETWQLMLWKSVTPPIAEADKFNDSSYPEEWRVLIALLVVHDVLRYALNESFLASLTQTEIDEEGNTVIGPGTVKKTSSQPTEVEYYSGADELSKLIKAGLTGQDGLLNQFRMQICMLARSIGIKLPMCAAIKVTVLPMKSKIGLSCIETKFPELNNDCI